MRVRRFRSPDAAACCAIVNACVDRMEEFDAPTRELLRAKNVPQRLEAELAGHHALVCERDGAVVGLGARDGSTILRVFVHPDAHGQGVGRLLMESLEALAPANVLRLQSSLAAVPFYERLGWEPHEKIVDRVGPATFRHVRMTKSVRSTK